MAQGMVKNMCTKLSKLNALSCDETKGLYESIECCELADQYKDALRDAVDKVVAQPVADLPEAAVLKPQLLINIPHPTRLGPA